MRDQPWETHWRRVAGRHARLRLRRPRRLLGPMGGRGSSRAHRITGRVLIFRRAQLHFHWLRGQAHTFAGCTVRGDARICRGWRARGCSGYVPLDASSPWVVTGTRDRHTMLHGHLIGGRSGTQGLHCREDCRRRGCGLGPLGGKRGGRVRLIGSF